MASTKSSSTNISTCVNMTTVEEEIDQHRSCIFWHITSGKTVVIVIISILILFLLTFLVNSLLLVGLMRLKEQFWKPYYTILNNLLICRLLQCLVIAMPVMHSLMLRRTLIFGEWCKAHFAILVTGFFNSQMTIDMMAIERYVFICHSIHYLRIMTLWRVRLALGVIWLLSVTVGINHLVLLNQGQGAYNQATAGLLCEPRIVRASVSFNPVQKFQLQAPPVIMITLSVIIFCSCYRQIYTEACRAVVGFQLSNKRACRTVSYYLSMFSLQLIPFVYCAACTVLQEQTLAFQLSRQGSVQHVTLIVLHMVPPFINPIVVLIRNKELKFALFGENQRRYWESEFSRGRVRPCPGRENRMTDGQVGKETRDHKQRNQSPSS